MKMYLLSTFLIFALLISSCSGEVPEIQEKSDSPSQMVPVDPDSGVEEMIVEEQDDAQESMTKETEKKPNVVEIDVKAFQFDFEPSTIRVKEGDRVKLNVVSTDVAHGLSIPQFGVNEVLEPGIPVTVEFTADKKGTFSMRCSVYCGSGHSSMEGILIVE